MNASDLVSLRTAAEWFPRRGASGPSKQTLTKWIETGIQGVRLKAIQSGGEWFTCREWVEEFLLARH